MMDTRQLYINGQWVDSTQVAQPAWAAFPAIERANLLQKLAALVAHDRDALARVTTAIVGRIPAGRWGEAEDLAGVTAFLASAAANYVNSSIVTVDGGWMGR